MFGKQFIVMPTGSGNESRLISLLHIIGLESRLYTTYDSFKKDLSWQNKIDYVSVWNKLKPIVEKSEVFLNNQL